MEDKSDNQSPFISNNYFSERTEENSEGDQETQGLLGGEISADLGFGNLAAAKEYAEKFNLANEEEQENQTDSNQE